MTDSVTLLVGFGHALREAGVPVGPARIRTFCEAAAVLPSADLYWAGRVALTWSPDHIPIYDEVFFQFFGIEVELEAQEPTEPDSKGTPEVAPLFDGEEEITSPSQERTASHGELLLTKSFARCSEQELLELAEILARLPSALPLRRTRRYKRGGAGHVDLGKTLRGSVSTGGEPFDLRERSRRVRVRPVLFLLDVSGSMEAYSRGALLFAHAALRSNPLVDVYAFGTRLTHLTPALAVRSFDEALRASETLVPDWDGGTRIGAAIEELLGVHGRRASIRRAIVVISSDGLETGDPVMLGRQVARLQRLTHRVVWLNPLKEDPRYEPLARGMREALPAVDVFESGHNLISLMRVFADLSAERDVPRSSGADRVNRAERVE